MVATLLAVSVPAVGLAAAGAIVADGTDATGSPPVAVEPEEVTLHVTRYCPSWLGHFICGDSAPPTVGVAEGILSAQAPLRRIASSSTGGTATFELKASSSGERLPSSLIPAIVTANADTHGTYSTTFPLEPEAKQDGTLKVNLEVQDWWPIPLGVLIIGAFLGYLTRWLMGSYRDRRLLKARLLEQRNEYAQRLPSQSPGLYPLTEWFGEPSEPLPAIPQQSECDSDMLTGFASTWCEVHRARSAEDIEAARTEVERLSSDVKTWREANIALKELAVRFEQAEPNVTARESDMIPAFLDTLMLVTEQVLPKPASGEDAEKKLAAVRNQAVIVDVYAAARRAWEQLTPDQMNAHQDLNPHTVYGEPGKVLSRSPEEATTLKARLIEVTLQLRALVVPAPEPPVSLATAMLAVQGDQSGEDLASTLPAPLASLLGVHEGPPTIAVETRAPAAIAKDPAMIRRAVSAIDWLVFLATLIVSATLYFLTLYVGKSFGGTSQYVEAFAAGFAGQAIVGVATIPLAKSLVTVAKQSQE
jgi:hypothetical protein